MFRSKKRERKQCHTGLLSRGKGKGMTKGLNRGKESACGGDQYGGSGSCSLGGQIPGLTEKGGQKGHQNQKKKRPRCGPLHALEAGGFRSGTGM